MCFNKCPHTSPRSEHLGEHTLELHSLHQAFDNLLLFRSEAKFLFSMFHICNISIHQFFIFAKVQHICKISKKSNFSALGLRLLRPFFSAEPLQCSELAMQLRPGGRRRQALVQHGGGVGENRNGWPASSLLGDVVVLCGSYVWRCLRTQLMFSKFFKHMLGYFLDTDLFRLAICDVLIDEGNWHSHPKYDI